MTESVGDYKTTALRESGVEALSISRWPESGIRKSRRFCRDGGELVGIGIMVMRIWWEWGLLMEMGTVVNGVGIGMGMGIGDRDGRDGDRG